MKKRTLIAMALSVMLSASILAGCSADDSSSTGSSTSEGSSANSSSEASSDSTTGSGTVAITDNADTFDPGEEVIYEGEGTVYFAIPDSSISRWPNFDVPAIEKWLAVYAPNCELEVLDAEGDTQKQLQQIESAITSGCDFMIYAAADEASAAGALAALNESEIPFCALAHTPYGGDVPIMVTAPFPTIAQSYLDYMEENLLADATEPVKVACIWGAQGAAFYTELTETYYATLDQWEEEGKIEIVYEADTNGWTASVSAPVAEQMLTSTGGDVDVIITMNDDLMTGIVSVLVDQGELEGKTLLGGCDCTVEGLARVQEGIQAADSLPNYDEQGKMVAWIAAKWMNDGECPYDRVDRIFDNESENGIPQICISTILITEENFQEEVIDKGVATEEEIEQIAQTLRG